MSSSKFAPSTDEQSNYPYDLTLRTIPPAILFSDIFWGTGEVFVESTMAVSVKKNRVGNVVVLPQDARANQGVWLLLAALSIFFVSSILLYVVYVAMRIAPESGMKPHPFYLPKSFLPSTLLLVGVSCALEWALRSARRDRVQDVKRATLSAFIMGMLFMAIQSEGMYRLIYAASVSSSRNSAYALTFVLALVHALHVVGGIVGLVSTVFNARRYKYDHERNFGLRFCTLYWHFLDIVWVLLLASFVISGALINRHRSHEASLRDNPIPLIYGPILINR